MVHNQHYLYRMTVLVAITSLASVVSHETLYQTILPAVVSCAKDKVIGQSNQGLSICLTKAMFFLVYFSAEYSVSINGRLLLHLLPRDKPVSSTDSTRSVV